MEIFHFVAARVSRWHCSAPSCCILPPRRAGRGPANALLWTHLNQVKGDLEPTVLKYGPFVFLLVGTAPRSVWCPRTAGCRMRLRKAQRRFQPVPGCC